MNNVDTANAQSVLDQVRRAYAAIAGGGTACCGGREPSSCGTPAAGVISSRLGYAAGELAALPPSADMGLSCGNPTALAELKVGETVLDLGSGGGLDGFLAGRKVGPKGRVIGVDMTPEMVARARGGLAEYRASSGLDNVEFRLGEIEHLPVADGTVDVVISNCVLNLSPDKPQVWREIARVLRPGGRVAVSDLALLRPLPGSIQQMVEALVGCVAGAVPVEDTRAMMRDAGLTNIRLTPRPGYVETLDELQDPLYARIVQQLPAGTKASDYITSLEATAVKPAV